MLDLESAIKHCEEEVKKQRSKAHVYEDMMIFDQTIEHNSETEYYEELMNECIECAEEYHQFAKWLRELKAYRRYSILPCYLMESKISEEVNADG